MYIYKVKQTKQYKMKTILYTIYTGTEEAYEKVHIPVDAKNAKQAEKDMANDPTILYFEKA